MKKCPLSIPILALFLHGIARDTFALDNGLAKLPPLGWNSWNVQLSHVTLNEAFIKGIADAMVSSGLAAAGYQYVCVDGGWAQGRPNGVIGTDPSKFPGGMKALGDYIHSKGLKFGIYLGNDSPGHEKSDAAVVASFGADYLKYDAYKVSATDSTWVKMRDALKATGRPILYSIHHANEINGMSNAAGIANMERVTNDVQDHYLREGSGLPSYWYPTTEEVDYSTKVNHLMQPGFMCDMDMLWVGHSGQTTDEYKTQFGMWAILGSPLILGNDLRSMDQTVLDILKNGEILAVNQDSALNHTTKVSDANGAMVYVKPLGTIGGVKAVACMNRNSSTVNINVPWNSIGLLGKAMVRDLWSGVNVGEFSGSYTATVPAHGCAMLKITADGSNPILKNFRNPDPVWFRVDNGRDIISVFAPSEYARNSLRISVDALTGKSIYSAPLPANDRGLEISTRSFPKGMCILSVKYPDRKPWSRSLDLAK